jgi:hypothetical protein
MQCIIQLDQTAHTAKHDDKARPAEEERVPSLTLSGCNPFCFSCSHDRTRADHASGQSITWPSANAVALRNFSP